MALDLAYIFVSNFPLYWKILVAWFVIYPNLVVIFYVYRGRAFLNQFGNPIRIEGNTVIDVTENGGPKRSYAYKGALARKKICERIFGLNMTAHLPDEEDYYAKEENTNLKSIFLFYENIPQFVL